MASSSIATRSSSKKQRIFKRFIILVSTILIITIITAPLRPQNNSPLAHSTLDTNSENSLKIFCSVTQDPPMCFTSISAHLTTVRGVERPGPDDFFTVALEVAIHNITSLPPIAKHVLVGSTMVGAEATLDHCIWGFDHSLRHLNRVLNESQTFPTELSYEALTSEKKEELVTWLINGMSGLEALDDVLDQAAVGDLSVKVYKARVRARNIVDFLIHRDEILEKIHSISARISYNAYRKVI